MAKRGEIRVERMPRSPAEPILVEVFYKDAAGVIRSEYRFYCAPFAIVIADRTYLDTMTLEVYENEEERIYTGFVGRSLEDLVESSLEDYIRRAEEGFEIVVNVNEIYTFRNLKAIAEELKKKYLSE